MICQGRPRHQDDLRSVRHRAGRCHCGVSERRDRAQAPGPWLAMTRRGGRI